MDGGGLRSKAVQVLYGPNGREIKIVAEPLWLRYQWDASVVLPVWVLACGAGLIVSHRRLCAVSDQAE